MLLYVGNLESDITREDLRDLFAEHGQISGLQIIDDRITGIRHRYGLVDMPRDAEAIAAIIALHGIVIKNCRLNVHRARLAEEDRRKSGRGGGRRKTDPPLTEQL